MKINFRNKKLINPFIVGICLLLTGCSTIGLAQESTFESAYENTLEEEPVINIYTSQGYGVLEAVDFERNTFTVYFLNSGEERTLAYDGVTSVEDRFGSSMSMQQMLPGDIVQVAYNSDLEKAGTIALSADSWDNDSVERYQIDESRGSLTIGSDVYSLSSRVKVFSEGKQIKVDQIIHQDVLCIKGIGREVVSIVVEKGHGYLDLENEEELVGGWIEVGQAVIQQISQDMLITVPEGSYTVRLTTNGVEETREIIIERDKETELDLGNIEVPKPVNGKVSFIIKPENADVLVDGVEINPAYTVLLPFGLHQITVMASGYDSASEYFQVEGELTTVRLSLTEERETSTVSGNSLTSTHTITIQAPLGVQVYHDNLYMGIAPVTYTKSFGTHVITLRKEGYITQSHQIVVEDDGRDVTYAFPDLQPENSDNTVSGNTVSGNSSSQSETQNSTVSGNTVSGNEATVNGNE